MAVRLEGTIKRFIGTSTDEKPTTDVPPGSSFLESNTGVVSRYDGTVWTAQPGMSTGGSGGVSTSTTRMEALLEVAIEILEDIREILSS